MPVLVLIAGPNGSGKSTIASQGFLDRLLQSPEDDPPIKINPDSIAQELRQQHPDAPRERIEAEAATLADTKLLLAINAGRSVIRETVLSTERLLPVVQRAKAKGYRFFLIFVLLWRPELNVARVRARVAMGGHDVPEAKVRDRWDRAMHTAPAFAELADGLLIFDNSTIANAQGGRPALLVDFGAEGLFVAKAVTAIVQDRLAPAALKAMLVKVLAKLEHG